VQQGSKLASSTNKQNKIHKNTQQDLVHPDSNPYMTLPKLSSRYQKILLLWDNWTFPHLSKIKHKFIESRLYYQSIRLKFL